MIGMTLEGPNGSQILRMSVKKKNRKNKKTENIIVMNHHHPIVAMR